MAATEQDVIEMIKRNFNSLHQEVKASIDEAITPEAIFAIHMLIGPQTANFLETKQAELRTKYNRGEAAEMENPAAAAAPPAEGM